MKVLKVLPVPDTSIINGVLIYPYMCYGLVHDR